MAFAAHKVIPVLRIFDERKAREFYLEFLGCTIDFEHRFHDGAPLFMQVSRDCLCVRLSEHHGDGTPGTCVHVVAGDIDALHVELEAKKYKYMNPGIVQQPWGRELGVIDPFNNRITFIEERA